MSLESDVTVVVPVYNRSSLLKRCLDSLVDQTYQNFSVIISDDESEEDIHTVVSEFIDRLDVKCVRSEHFGGPARPRNVAIQQSKAKYIAFLDSDDFWHPSKLETSLAVLRKSNADVVYHDLCKITSPIKRDYSSSLINSREINQSALHTLCLYGNCIPNSSAVVRRKTLLKVHLVDEDPRLISVEDYDLWIKLAMSGSTFKRINSVLGYYQDESGISAKGNLSRLLTAYSALYRKYENIALGHRVSKSPYIMYQYAFFLCEACQFSLFSNIALQIFCLKPYSRQIVKYQLKLLILAARRLLFFTRANTM